MESTFINTAEDLAAAEGTPEFDAFMVQLAGSLWRLDRDDAAGAWVAVADESTVNRFGLSAADFPDAVPPALPVYVAFVEPVPTVVTTRQARLALLAAGHLTAANNAVAAMTGPDGDVARIQWEFSASVERDDALTQTLIGTLGLTEADVDALFVAGAAL